MNTPLKTAAVAAALIVGLAAAPALYAQGTTDTPTVQTAPMGQGNMADMNKAMGQVDMKDMNKMMAQMGKMMQNHGKFMQTMIDAHGATQPKTE